MFRSILLAALVVFGLGAGAAQETDALDAKIRSFLDAVSPKARDEAAAGILALKPDFDAVRVRLAAGRRYVADAKTGWISFTVPGADGAENPHVAWIPETYDPAKRYPLIIDMHGGVSRPEVVPDEAFTAEGRLRYRAGKIAQEAGWILLVPKGKSGFAWWQKAGAGNVLQALDWLKAHYNVDENRVFPTGFSDGGSGTYYFGMSDPTPFAGLIPLNGMPVVAQIGGLQAHLRNLVNRPIYAVNTGRDTLYPAALVKPFFDLLKREREDVIWTVYEKMPHAPLYMDEERPKIRAWMEGVVRTPYPTELVWETADPKGLGRIHWLTVDEIGDRTGAGKGFPDLNPKLKSSRVRLGIQIDRSASGEGVTVSVVTPRSTAAAMGVEKGDHITALDGHDLDQVAESQAERSHREVSALDALRAILRGKKPGQSVKVTVKRGQETLELEGAFADPPARAAFDRRRPWGSIRARIDRAENKIHVTSHNVRCFALDLSPELVDFERPVTVVVNGQDVVNRSLLRDVRVLLERAVQDRDRTMLYAARVHIHVPAADD